VAALADGGFGPVLAPDLPGHGAAAPATRYSLGEMAAAIAAGLPPAQPYLVAGHSLGGYVALALASGWFGEPPRAVLSVGAKLVFTDADGARAREAAARDVRVFPTRAAALERYRKVAGLTMAIAPDEASLGRGVVACAGGFRLAQDPGTFAIAVPAFAALLAAAACPSLVVRGEHDPLVSAAELGALDARTDTLAGLGHNAHVEAPERIAALIAALAARPGGARRE
jgi:pimeloyl-ACP methyl ester carboxylesterase